jgi:hypothetical protein
VGNASYDAAKRAITHRWRGRNARSEPMEEALAKAAVRHQFERLSWDLPEDANMRVQDKKEAERNGEQVWVMEIRCDSPQFSSTVIVPHPDLRSLGILVAIRRTNQ